jgi:hypothetical protein
MKMMVRWMEICDGTADWFRAAIPVFVRRRMFLMISSDHLGDSLAVCQILTQSFKKSAFPDPWQQKMAVTWWYFPFLKISQQLFLSQCRDSSTTIQRWKKHWLSASSASLSSVHPLDPLGVFQKDPFALKSSQEPWRVELTFRLWNMGGEIHEDSP